LGIIVHPYQKQDFLNDKDALRRDELLLRLNQYQTIASPPLPTKEDLIMLNWNESSNNDKIDNYLLYSLYRNVVHLLITNDKSIIKKAKRIIHLKERVHTIDNFLAFLKKQISPTFETPAGINSVYLYNLDIKSHFFQSLRNEYNNFNTWFTKCCFENRKAWSVITNNNIHALCIYKIEEDECIADDTEKLHGKILKLCTFKVSEDLRGRKLGERLLFTSFKFAISNQLKYIYIYTYK
jgi:hypothetical protein